VHEPEAEWLSSTGEPDALKGACPVRRGPDGKGAIMLPRRLATLLLINEERTTFFDVSRLNFLKVYASIFDFLK
jgi:hypothetical protein